MDFNLAEISESIATAYPDRECLVWRDRRLRWSELNERTRRLANYLLGRGLRLRMERSELEPWESGQDHVALYLYNCPEYLEGMLGAFQARLVPLNVNYRYVAEELVYLLRDCAARAVVYHAAFAPTLASIRSELPALEVLLQVGDESGNSLLEGAVDYEEALASAATARPAVAASPDDLYAIYTGGTTGRPKAVLWRQADIYVAALGGRTREGGELDSLEQVVQRAVRGGFKMMPTAPLMHAAHWSALDMLHGGNTVVLQDVTQRLDPDSIWRTVEQERVQAMLIVGDAFARPLLEQLQKQSYDLSSLKLFFSGGAVLHVRLKEELLRLLPEGARIVDTVGSSETGTQAANVSSRKVGASTGSFRPNRGACVLDADCTRLLRPGEDEIGWFAQAGRVPLGYLGDREKTQRTFPKVGGVRYSIPGDRARLLADGVVEVLGRDSVTINSGGEKIFSEEVEQAIKQHPSVYDAVVCGRPSERWGSEVVALVRLRAGVRPDEEELRAECAKHLARYKLPKAFVFTDEIVRSPSGKPDYRWAQRKVAAL